MFTLLPELVPEPGQKLDTGRHSDFPPKGIYSCGHSAGFSPDSPAGIFTGCKDSFSRDNIGPESTKKSY